MLLGRDNPHPPLTPDKPEPFELGESLAAIGRSALGQIRQQLGGTMQAAGEYSSLLSPATMGGALTGATPERIAEAAKYSTGLAKAGAGIAESGSIEAELAGVDNAIEEGIASGLAMLPSIGMQLAAPGSGLPTMLAGLAGASYHRMRADKKGPVDAGRYAGAQAVAELASEKLFKMPFLRAFESLGEDGAKGFVKWVTQETGQELSAEVLQAGIDVAMAEPDMTLAQFVDRIIDTGKALPSALLTQRLAARGAQKSLDMARKIPEKIHARAQKGYPTPRAANRKEVLPQPTQEAAENEPVAPAEPPIKVFHGSGKVFERLSASAIGSGEGAQAFGWGLYFAERKGIAGGYAKSTGYGKKPWITRTFNPQKDPVKIGHQIDRDQAIIDKLEAKPPEERADRDNWLLESLKKRNQERKEQIKKITHGQLYEVEIPAAVASMMIDWDKPLNQQPPAVKAALDAFQKKYPDVTNRIANGERLSQSEKKAGLRFIKLVGPAMKGGQNASRALLSVGIQGVRYLDGPSREKGEGTRNYVVFDENAPVIIRRNGEPVLSSAKRVEAERGAAQKASQTPRAANPREQWGLGTDYQPSAEEILNAPVPDDIVPGVNLTKMESSDQVKNALGLIANNDPEVVAKRKIPVPWEQTVDNAVALGMTPRKLKQIQGNALDSAQIRSVKVLTEQSATHVVDLAQRAVDSGSARDVLAFEAATQRHRMIQSTFAGEKAEIARALNILRRVTKEGELAGNLAEILGSEAPGRTESALASARRVLRVAETGNAAATSGQIGNEATPTKFGMVMEGYINFLLSGPTTHAVNISSNAITQLMAIPEHVVAAGLGKILPRSKIADKVYLREIPHLIYGMTSGAIDGAVLAADVFIQDQVYDPMTKVDMPQKRAIKGVVGDVINLPTRALAAEDEFFKLIAYRKELHSLAVRSGMKQGLRGQDLYRHIAEQMRSPEPALHLGAIKAGRYYTFTESLGKWMRGYQRWMNQIPALRLVTPFIRTPVNIVHFGLERVAPFAAPNFWKNLANASHEESVHILTAEYWKRVWKEGGANRDLALARAAIGQTLALAAVELTRQGLMTGGGPDDPEERSLWLQDHLPYSVKVQTENEGMKWRSFARLEPFGIVLGAAADYAEISGKFEQGERDGLASLIAAAFARNLTNKTFLTGLSKAVGAATGTGYSPTSAMSELIEGVAGAAVPTGIAQKARRDDPYLRETRDSGEGKDTLDLALSRVMNKWKSRIPGMSELLPYRRGPWGEPIYLEPGWGPDAISPIYQKQASNDPINAKLLEIGVVPGFVQRKILGYELNPDDYSVLQEAVGRGRRIKVEAALGAEGFDMLPRFQQEEKVKKALSDGTRLGKEAFLELRPDIKGAAISKELDRMRRDIEKRQGELRIRRTGPDERSGSAFPEIQ